MPLKLRRSLPGTILISFALAGCAVRSLEGAWYGSFALKNAETCRLRLRDSHAFDLECQGKPNWFGNGKWRLEDQTLSFRFELLTKDNEPLSKELTELRFLVAPGTLGNELRLLYPDTRQPAFTLRREVHR